MKASPNHVHKCSSLCKRQVHKLSSSTTGMSVCLSVCLAVVPYVRPHLSVYQDETLQGDPGDPSDGHGGGRMWNLAHSPRRVGPGKKNQKGLCGSCNPGIILFSVSSYRYYLCLHICRWVYATTLNTFQ